MKLIRLQWQRLWNTSRTMFSILSRLNGDKIENIFKYVMPKEIFVPHTEKHRNVAIMCNYKFDIEHGIAVLFENGQFKKVGPQDIAL